MNSVMDKKGRVWIPEELARELGIEGAVEAKVERVGDTLVVHIGESVPDDYWDSYLPSERVAREEASRRSQDDPGYRLTSDDFERLIADPSFLDEIRSNPKYRAAAGAVAAAGA